MMFNGRGHGADSRLGAISSQDRLSEPGEGGVRLEAIYLAAAALFVRQGFAATSMSEIADAVGLSKPGLYHFVRTKEGLLFTLMTWGMDALDTDVVEPSRHIEDPLAQLAFMIRAHLINIGQINTAMGNPFAIILDEPAGLTAVHRRLIQARKRRYFHHVRARLTALKADGRLLDVDPTIATFSILGQVVWFARWHRPDGPADLDLIADQMTATALRGVIRPDALDALATSVFAGLRA